MYAVCAETKREARHVDAQMLLQQSKGRDRAPIPVEVDPLKELSQHLWHGIAGQADPTEK